MKKTLEVDEELLREAKESCGASTESETIRPGLEALIRHAACEKLRRSRGSEKDAVDAPRRREGVR